MALVTSGPMVGFSGTVDGFTYSPQPNGTTVVKKKNSSSTKPFTPAQLSVQEDTRIFNQLMEPLTAFVKVGYELEAKRTFVNPYNMMVKHCKKACIEGTYPNRQVNFEKVLVCKGNLPMPKQVAAEMTEKGLAIEWSTELIPRVTHQSDQVIMLAVFPELKEARYMTAGAQRHTGKDLLELQGIESGFTAEVYVSFTTDDRSGIADSSYLGQFTW